MADKDNAESEDAQEEKGGKKKLIFMIVGAVALVGLGIGGTVMFMGGDKEGEEVAVEEPPKDPIFIALDPTFVINYRDADAQNRFLKAELNVMTFEEEVEDAVFKHMPLIRNNLVMLFNQHVFEDLLQNEGKEVLRAEALAQVQSVIESQLGRPGIEQLYFTTFVMQ